MEQAKKALELQPKHAEAQQLVKQLEAALRETPSPAEPAPSPIIQAHATHPVATVDVNNETLITFTTKVQPILMNTCASCHSTGRGGNFSLERVSGGTQKAVTQRNLAKVLTYIDHQRPAISPLLVMAITNHAKMAHQSKPPLNGRDAPAFQVLQSWIEGTIAGNPQLKDYAAVRQANQQQQQPSAQKTKPAFASGSTFASLDDPVVSPKTPTHQAVKQQPQSLVVHADMTVPAQKVEPPRILPASVTQTATAAPLEVIDEFDQQHFNKVYHPQR
jgi:hypothetical protein